MNFEELCQKAIDAILDMDEDVAYETLDEAIHNGYDLMGLLSNGYSVGMQKIGELFSEGEYFLPDLMLAAEIMSTVSKKIDEELLKNGAQKTTNKSGVCVFATVQGDVHDIGKGICCTLLQASGYAVYDMGRDVPAEAIVDKAEEVHADVIGLSALLTTTMDCQKDVIDLLVKRDIRDKYKVMVGGAPVTSRWADKIGADYYTEDAAECAEVAARLIG